MGENDWVDPIVGWTGVTAPAAPDEQPATTTMRLATMAKLAVLRFGAM